MKTSLITFVLIQISLVVFSQNTNQVFVGGGFLGLDSPNNHGYRIAVGYAKYLKNDRIKYSARLSGLKWKVNNWSEVIGGELVDVRKRTFIDLDVSFAPIKYKGSFLRFGAGPTLMYKNDYKVNYVKTTLEFDTKTKLNYFKYVSHEAARETKLNLGLNTMACIEISINSKFSVMSDFSILFIDQGLIPFVNTYFVYKF